MRNDWIITEPGVHFNDLLLAHQFVTPDSPVPLLDDYLIHAIPKARSSPKALYQPIHSGPPKICPNPSCNGAESSITSVSTEWPLLLRVDPICRSYNPELHPPMAQLACPLTLNLGPTVHYELIARVIFMPAPEPDGVGHYVTKTRLKGQTYLYNDLRRNGTLTELGPLHLLEDFDPNTAYVLYLRTSKTSTTSRTVAEMQADFEKVPSQPRSEIEIFDDSSDKYSADEQGANDDEVAQMLIDSITSPDKKSRTTSKFIPEHFYNPDEALPPSPRSNATEMDHERSFAETNSQTACPVRCHGCGVNKPDGDNIYEEVQCEKCKNWSHIECLPSGVDWHAEDVRFICQYSRDDDPLGEFLWPGRIKAAPQRKYEFQWLECTDGAAYHSEGSLMPPELLRKFTREGGFCEDIDNIDLTAEQLGKVRLPFYLCPDHPQHKNPERTTIFYFQGKKPAERRRGLSDWMERFDLVPTPELEEVLSRPLITLLGQKALSKLPEEDRNDRRAQLPRYA
ncbi:hypothetical protein B0H13DRAFT_2317298 [Mycena leptocephala]|nr:hypothetical protein B0H13DRAFT_2317298 [Mycena leptocephala]